MSALAVEHVYRYLHPSDVSRDASGPRLALATSSGPDDHPYFFEGRLARPKQTADLLRGLMAIVHARYHIPPAMLERILAMADPVVTSSDDRLRFEGFSGCCGVYARVDLLPNAVDGEQFGRGTTNVDFNTPMLSALAQIRDTDTASLSVGADEVRLSKGEDEVVEKRVRLPHRWLKGFLEVQAYQSRMQHVLEVSGIEARRFLRSLPRMKTHRQANWVVPIGRGLRLTQREFRDGVRVAGLERLRVLEGLAHRANQMRVYRDQGTGASAWELEFHDSRFHVVLSPEVWRGFSGEGQALRSLASAGREEILASIRAQLRWQAVVDADELLASCESDAEAVLDALAVLGTRGLVGYDLGEGCYFHRELPFDLSQVEKLQPRLLNARKLVLDGKVRITSRSDDRIEALVAGSGVEHRVRFFEGEARCTCPWFAKHQGHRGPCKHVLAAEIVLDNETSDIV